MIVLNPYKNGLNDRLDELGIENYSVGYRLNICKKNGSGLKYYLKFFIKYVLYILSQGFAKINIKRKIDFSEIDIIHTNNSVMDIGAHFAKKYQKKHIWHLREFGKEDFNFVYFKKNYGKYISNNASKVIAITNIVKDSWVSKGVDVEKVRVITHGVSNQKFINLTRNQSDDKIKFIFLGNIVPEKGQFGFIKALSKLSDQEKSKLELHLYGSITSGYQEELSHFIQKNNLEDVVFFKGYIKNVEKVLPNYDIGIVNSKCEAMGRVTIEYMMAGLCVFASNRGANTELLRHGQMGVLYEYGNEDEIRSLLQNVVENIDLYRAMGEKSKSYAFEQFSIENNVNKFIELYRECLVD